MKFNIKNFLIVMLGVVGFAGVVYAAPTQTFLRNTLPEANNTYDLGSTSPNLRWKNIYTTNLNVSGTCTGCGGGGSLSGGSPNSLTYWIDGTTVSATSSPTVGYIVATSTTATSTFAGGLTVDGGTLTVNAGGDRVGVGIINPNDKLHIAATPTTGSITLSGTSAPTTQYAKILFSNSGDNSLNISTFYSGGTNNNISFSPANTEKMRIEQDGDLGVGTTTPYAKLSVTNTGSGPSFVVEDSTSPDITPFIIDSAGDVMVGTTTNPSSYKLTVQGTGNAANFVGPTYFHSLNEPTGTTRGIAITGNVFSGDNNIEAYNNSGGKFTFNSRNTGNGTSTAAIMMDPASRYISFHTATSTNSGSLGSWANEQMRLTGQGFLGVGTTSPGQKLSVAGDILGNNLIGTYFTATSTTATSTFANGINLSGGCFAINNTCVSGAGGGGSGTVNTGVANYFAYYPSGGTTVDDQTVLNIVSGNVGIGTTTPSKLLAVGGDILGNNIISSYFTATSTLATSTFYGPVDASSLTVRSPRASRGLLLGDSTTATYLGISGIDTFLATSSDTVLGTQITNDAVPGDTISQQQTAWTNDTNKAKYDWIMVMVGLNDYASATSTIISDYQTLINTINSGKKESAVIIVATTVPAKQRYIDLLGQSAGLQAFSKVSALNEAIMGGGSTPITGVQFRINKHYNALSDGAGNLALAYDSGDGIHENNLGRQLIAKVFRESLNNIGYLTNTPSGVVSDYWVNNGTSIYLKSANPTINTTNLGIGTTSPGTLLSIGSIANFSTTSSALYVPMKVTNTGTGNSFTVEDSASDTSPFVVDASGNVGIGTASPSYLEHALVTTDSENGIMIENNNGGTSAGAAFYLKNNAGTIGGMNVLSSNHVASWLAGQTNLLSQSGLTLVSSSNVQNGGTSPITFYTGGWDYTNERMRLTASGLGVGTTSPYARLSVNGQIVGGNVVATTSNFSGGFNVSNIYNMTHYQSIGGQNYLVVRPYETNATSRVGFFPNGTVSGGNDTMIAGLKIFGTDFSQDETNNNDFGIYVTPNSNRFNSKKNGSETAKPFMWSTQDSTYLMTLTTAGSLGIGTTTPGKMLSVSGDMLANNIIGSYFTATSTTATSTFANGVNLSSGCFAINNNCISGAGGSGTVNSGNAGYFSYYPSNGTTVDDQTVLNISGSNIGIGTSTPFANLSITNTGSGNSLVIEDQASPDPSPVMIDASGRMSIGTSTTSSMLDVVRTVGGFTGPPSLLSSMSTVANFVDNSDTISGVIYGNASTGNIADYRFILRDSSDAMLTMAMPGVNNSLGNLLGRDRKTASYLFLNGSSSLRDLGIGTVQAKDLFFGTTNAERMVIAAGGNVGVATTSPWRKLSVVGTVAFNGLTSSTAGNAVCILTNFDVVTAGGTTCTTSSAKTKHDILTINESTARKIMKLRPVEYVSNESNEERYGFIAEEVAKIDPKLVEYAKSDITLFDGQVIKKGEPLSVDYNRYTGLLTKFVQDIYNGLQKLIAKVAGLENKLNKQQQEIDLLKVEIEKLKVNINK